MSFINTKAAATPAVVIQATVPTCFGPKANLAAWHLWSVLGAERAWAPNLTRRRLQPVPHAQELPLLARWLSFNSRSLCAIES